MALEGGDLSSPACLLLMAFGKPGEKKDSEEKMSPQIASTNSEDSLKNRIVIIL